MLTAHLPEDVTTQVFVIMTTAYVISLCESCKEYDLSKFSSMTSTLPRALDSESVQYYLFAAYLLIQTGS